MYLSQKGTRLQQVKNQWTPAPGRRPLRGAARPQRMHGASDLLVGGLAVPQIQEQIMDVGAVQGQVVVGEIPEVQIMERILIQGPTVETSYMFKAGRDALGYLVEQSIMTPSDGLRIWTGLAVQDAVLTDGSDEVLLCFSYFSGAPAVADTAGDVLWLVFTTRPVGPSRAQG